MNDLLKNGIITELPCGDNFLYILDDDNEFLMTDYKFLQSQVNGGFIKSMKMLYNGKIGFFYKADNFKSFQAIIPSINTDIFMTITSNLFSNIVEVKNNGFLSCQNIDISFDKIFIDMNTLKVSLVYLPVRTRVFNDYNEFENKLRTNLIKLINSEVSFSNGKEKQFAKDLANGMLSLEDIYNGIKGMKMAAVKPKDNINNKNMRIIAINSPRPIEILVNKDNYVLGKNPSMVDGAITFNKAISRVHCKVTNIEGRFMLTDLDSVNGTYVNKVKLIPKKPHPLKNGDVIRLANSDFKIVID
ncbi:MAG: FHA domain-containing protein [Clostridium sartagoforme]|nr:FHA domain-containing protein [Clostridium sartagoforme]